MVSGYGSAGLACITLGIVALLTNRSRGKGHPMNGITGSCAFFSFAVSLVLFVPYMNLRNAPCWVAPVLCSIVLLAVYTFCYHFIRRKDDLTRVPHFELDQVEKDLLEEGQQKVEHLESMDMITGSEKDEYVEFIKRCMNSLERTGQNKTTTEGA
jgi:hypothetical protein